MGLMSKLKDWFDEPPQPTPFQIYRNTLRQIGYRNDGIVIGMNQEGDAIGKTMGQDGHILIVGGPGSGKSSCVAIPTLRYGWKSPALIIDIKGELYEKGYRSKSYVFNPLERTSPGYDPFYILYNSPNPSSDVEDIAKMIVPLSPNVKEQFWTLSAQNILAAHLLYSFKHGATFLQAIRTLQGTPASITMEIIEEEDAEAGLFLTQCLDLAPQTLSGVMQELSTRIRPFVTDEFLRSTLSKRNVITPHMLEQGYDIFLQLPAHKLEVWRPLISLIIQQFLRHLEQRSEHRSNKHILFMLDEFPRLDKMDMIVHGLATLRSKNITIMVLIQSLAQLDAIYGQDNRRIICDNCDYKAVLRALDVDTQQYFSKLYGTYEYTKQSYSSSKTRGYESTSDSKTVGSSSSTEMRPRMKPEEFGTMQNIIYFNTWESAPLQKVPYWQI